MSKKIQMVLAGIGGTLLIVVLKAFFPDVPDDVIIWAITVIGAVPGLGATGQAIADGMSRGLTSSNAEKILKTGAINLNAKNPPSPAE